MKRLLNLLGANLPGAKGMILALVGALCLCGSPFTAYASNTDVTVPASGSADQNVTATFTIDNDTLIDLGFGAVVSVPITVPLTYDSDSKSFRGERSVFCSGVIADGKKVVVDVDDTSDYYGVISDSSNNTYSVKNNMGFAVAVTKTNWSKEEMAENLSYVQAGDAASILTAKLCVTIPGRGFVPKVTGSFENSTSLKEIHISKDITMPRSCVVSPFEGSGLEKIYIDEGVTKVVGYLFNRGCNNMTELSLPSTIKTLEGNGCTDVKRIVFPSTLTTIGSDAFEGCVSLTEVNLPSSVASIGLDAFEDSVLLTSFTVNSSWSKPSGANISPFTGSGLTDIYVRSGLTSLGLCLLLTIRIRKFRKGRILCRFRCFVWIAY